MDYRILESRVQAKYAGLAASDILGKINSDTIDVYVDVAVTSVAGYLGTQGLLQTLIAWAANPPSGANAASINAAQELSFALQNPGTIPMFHTSDATLRAQMQSMLNAITSPGTNVTPPFDATVATGIMERAHETPTWAAHHWGRSVTMSDLNKIGVKA